MQVAIGKIYGKRVVLTSKKLNILMRDHPFSTAALSEMELSNVEREGSGGKYPPLLLKLGWIIVLAYTTDKLVYFWQYTKRVVGY